MDVPTFRSLFPEFNELRSEIVQGAIARAIRWIDVTVWGQSKAEDGIAYLAAHFLVTSPFGMNTRLEPKNAEDTLDTSTYGKEFKELRQSVVTAALVAGGSRTRGPGGVGFSW